jgi:cytochrome c oxidase cbb3-type subunit 3
MNQQQEYDPRFEEDHLLEHSYDGIQEYDNPLPRWWVWLFWATIGFAPLYILFYHFGPGPSIQEQYDAEMVAFYDKQAEQLLALGDIDEHLLVGLMDDPSMIGTGEKIFQDKCATCHGVFGEGGIGPNLTDQYWLHGAQLEDVYRTIREGVVEKGMLAWERQLRPAQLLAVTAHVGTLLGTDPPNPKEAQGQQVERQPPPPKSDAVEASGEQQDAPDETAEVTAEDTAT